MNPTTNTTTTSTTTTTATSTATTVRFVDLTATNAPYRAELRQAFDRVLDSGDFSTGAEVAAFEIELAAQVGTRHAVGVGSGTAALHLALVAAGIGAGDEVILPANTFFASAEAIVAAGARPVPVDILPATANIDPEAAEAAITSSTAAIVAVHLYGQPADMTRLQHIAARNDLFLLEDAAQAIGATWAGQPAGSLGDAAAFSFYPTKNLGALGQAGAVSTSDRDLARKVAALRQHGEEPRNHHTEWGHNERLDGLQAAFLRAKLASLDEVQRLRDDAVARYDELLAAVEGIETLQIDRHARHVHHLFAVRVEDRDEVRAALATRGIETGVHYPTPIHLQPAAELAPAGSVPHAERHADRVVSLPLYPGIPADHVERCAEALATVVPGTARAGRATG